MPFYHRLRTIVNHCADKELGLYAAQASFFITLSAVPLFIVSLSLFRFVLPISYADFLQGIYQLTPTGTHALLTHLFNDAYRRSSATILSISSLTTLWSASKCVFALRKGLNKIHDIEKRRGYVYDRISSLFYTLALLLVLLFSFVVLIFGNKLQHILSQLFPFLSKFIDIFLGLRSLPAILILMTFFLGIYLLLPDADTTFKQEIPGAMFCTAGWLFLSFAFSFYVDRFTGKSMYGSLTAVVLTMLWLYLCMYLVLIGAELNIWLKDQS